MVAFLRIIIHKLLEKDTTLKNKLSPFMALAIIIVLASCAQRTSTNEIKRTRPDCSRAQEQLKMLDAEMVATHERVISGVSSVAPSLAVINILTGNYKTNVEVATGQYEKVLDQKINEIKTTCNLNNFPMKTNTVKWGEAR